MGEGFAFHCWLRQRYPNADSAIRQFSWWFECVKDVWNSMQRESSHNG